MQKQIVRCLWGVALLFFGCQSAPHKVRKAAVGPRGILYADGGAVRPVPAVSNENRALLARLYGPPDERLTAINSVSESTPPFIMTAFIAQLWSPNKVVRQAALVKLNALKVTGLRHLLAAYDLVAARLGGGGALLRLLADNKPLLPCKVTGPHALQYQLRRREFPGIPTLWRGILYFYSGDSLYAMAADAPYMLFTYKGEAKIAHYPLRVTPKGLVFFEREMHGGYTQVLLNPFTGRLLARRTVRSLPVSSRSLGNGYFLNRLPLGGVSIRKGERPLWKSQGEVCKLTAERIFVLEKGVLSARMIHTGKVVWSAKPSYLTTCASLTGGAVVLSKRSLFILSDDGRTRHSLPLEKGRAPVVRGEKLYLLHGEGPMLACVDVTAGRLLWSVKSPEGVLSIYGRGVAVLGDAFTSYDSTGKELWRKDRRGYGVRRERDELYLFSRNEVKRVGKAGQLLWSVTRTGQEITSVRFERDNLYIVGKYGVALVARANGTVLSQWVHRGTKPLYCGTSRRGKVACSSYKKVVVVTLQEPQIQNCAHLVTPLKGTQ